MFLLGSWCLAAALVLQGQEKYRSPLRCDEDLALCFDTWSLQDLFEKGGRQAARAGTADRHLRKDSSSGCKLGFSREAELPGYVCVCGGCLYMFMHIKRFIMRTWLMFMEAAESKICRLETQEK